MRFLFQSLSLCVAAAVLHACTDEAAGDAAPASQGAGIDVTIAPLNVESKITNAVYLLVVENNANEEIAQLTIDADRFGDGQAGAHAVLPCDADPAQQPNKVYLTVLSLMTGDPPTPDASISVPAPNILQTATCLPDQDVAVSFSPMIVESAGQGFFDIAVQLDRMLCSAKLDCEDSAGAPLSLLGNGSLPTVVMGFACAAGDTAAADTVLLMDNITINCGAAGTATIDPDHLGNLAEGSAMSTGGLLFGAAVYRGEESVASLNKLYWNAAFGLNQTALDANCSLTAYATAIDGAVAGPPYAAPVDHPYVGWWDIQITNGTAAPSCGRQALGGDGVYVAYPTSGNAATFLHQYAGPDPRVFVTSGTYGPSVFQDANSPSAICQVEASQAGLEGTYVAWFPSSNLNIVDTVYRRVDGVVVANSYADLTDGTLAAAINTDATGAGVTGAAWTGLTATGASGTPCGGGDWTSTTGTGTVGNVTATDGTWSDTGTPVSCGEKHHLYCFPGAH